MVKICSLTNYPDPNHYGNINENLLGSYAKHFDKYSYELSVFQKHAIQGIVDGNHVLVCAPTGSGKSLPAEFAIEFFTQQGKKVIYTSPIKALGNQKYHELSKKYTDISFGLITGDIKINPDAQVLIVTAEILLNKLYQLSSQSSSQLLTISSTSFDIDINAELGCVVMDEVHYINDPERGKVWEETIMMLPPQVQMIMLSATIDSPERFANWCETCKPDAGKIVCLAHTYTRIVPLTHYAFITSPSALYKAIKDKDKEEDLKKNVFDNLLVMRTSDGKFNEPGFHVIHNALTLLNNKQVCVKRAFVLNRLCEHLVKNNMLPALCFVLSRKKLEQCAQEITVELLEDDSKVGYTVKRECEQIIRKLPNYQEYLFLPEYLQMVALLEKGIAIHHAGIMPVLREMVELLYSKGCIKLLFATETFAVGLNMPTKTTIFTDICKFDGSHNRILHSHEYTQMAGRAGRRGIDTIGNVIHLPNLYKTIDISSFNIMLSGTPQTLSSKFRISYNLIFNYISKNGMCTINELSAYVQHSMMNREIYAESVGINRQIEEKRIELSKCDSSISYMKTPVQVTETYLDLLKKRSSAINKQRKEIDRTIEKILDEHKFIEKEKHIITNRMEKMRDYQRLQEEHDNCCAYIDNCVKIVIQILLKHRYLFRTEDDPKLNGYFFSNKGAYAQYFRETNCVVFSDLYESKQFDKLDEKQLACLFSCFTNVNVTEDSRTLYPATSWDIFEVIDFSVSSLQTYLKEENDNKIKTGLNFDIHFDLVKFIKEWWDANDERQCKLVLQRLKEEKDVSLGEFIKAILKINNIVEEVSRVAEINGDVDLKHKLSKIPPRVLKFVATNQSLYV